MAKMSESPPSLIGTSPRSFCSDESYTEVSPSELSDITPQAAGPDEGFMPLEEDSDTGLMNELTLTMEAQKLVYGQRGYGRTSTAYMSSDTSGMTSPADSETSALLPNRPEHLLLSREARSHFRRRGSSTSNSSCNSDSVIENLDFVLHAAQAPLHGTMTEKDGMISFIAEDLEEMIRMSSPASRDSQTPKSISSASSLTSSFCGSSFSGMSRSSSMPLQPSPDDAPAIDPHAVKDLETHARRVADNLDLLMGNLKINLHKMSRLSKNCLGVYSDGIEKTCDSVDASIKAMYALMAKCEEVSTSMQPIYKIAEQIREIKRLLDLFEAQIAKDAKEVKEKR